MIAIKKREAPQCLLEKQKMAEERHLNSEEAYNLLNKAEKAEIISALMSEQGHLCAYCSRRIPDNRVPPEDYEDIPPVTIEHWFPRKPSDGTEIGQGLDYQNFLAVCSGNRRKHKPGERRHGNGVLTCDAKRMGTYQQLTLNPCRPNTLESLYYTDDGKLCSHDPEIQDDINVKLNLNCQKDMLDLPRIREKVLFVLQSEMPEDEDEALAYCQQALSVFENETEFKTEYLGILIWWLKAYISSSQNTKTQDALVTI